MRLAITGATGFVGARLGRALCAAGHEVIALVRPKPGRVESELAARLGVSAVRSYDAFEVGSVRAALEGCEGVVNLAGENILGGRWSDAFLAHCRASRVDTTRALVEALAGLGSPPRVLLSASAVGYYGPRPASAELDERADAGRDILADLCAAWEAAAAGAQSLGTRVVCLRIGVVLGRGGGALASMERPFRWGLGGRIGSGAQVMSWIHVDDVVGLIRHALETETLRGPVNVTAPAPVTNAEFTRALAAQLRRPAFLPVPAFALKLMFGRGAAVLTTGQRVQPRVALDTGYEFQHAALADALAHIYPRS